MREIKFRIWDKENCKMVNPHRPVVDMQRALIFADILNGRNKEYKIMHFTGLIDKNGKEIYELMEINGKYKVTYNPPKYVLTDISNNDILSFEEVIKNENELTITKEYTEI